MSERRTSVATRKGEWIPEVGQGCTTAREARGPVNAQNKYANTQNIKTILISKLPSRPQTKAATRNPAGKRSP
jgi:hypothetical protein